MMQWVTETLQSASMGPAAVPLALLLGLVSAVASACCTLPAMGMLVAYSGTREDVNRRTALASAISFMAGTTLALIVLGFVAGFVGQAAQALLGRYWKVFAGLIAIVLGLAALKLLPLKLPQLARKAEARPSSPGRVRRGGGGIIDGGRRGGVFPAVQPGDLYRAGGGGAARPCPVGHGSDGRVWNRLQPAAERHPVRGVVWEGVYKGAEGGGGHPSRGGRSARRCRVLFAGTVLRVGSGSFQ